MTVQDYFNLLGYDHHSSDQYFFVQVKCVGEQRAKMAYTTPLRQVCDWWGSDEIMESFILNTRAFTTDYIGGASWNDGVLSGTIHSLLIISKEDMDKMYGEWQFSYLDAKIKTELTTKGLVGKFKRERKAGKIESYYIKENNRMLNCVRETLTKEGAVEVHNNYDTFYGAGFDNWLRKGLEDITCDIKVVSFDPRNDYPRAYLITLK